MNILRVKIYLYAVDCGSLTKAAQHFGYTPSGISHMMAAFEEEVGFPLLIRSKTGVIPTPDGERLIPILRSQCLCEEEFSQTVAAIQGLNCGSLRVSSYSSIASQWLPDILAAYHRDYPNIHIELLEGVWQEVEANLQAKRVDIGLYSHRDSVKHHWVPLRDDPMIVAVPIDHRLARQKSVRIRDLEGEALIMPAFGNDLDVADLFQREQFELPVTYRTLENYSAMGMVEKGMGVMIANALITKGRTNRFAILPVEPEAKIELGIAVPQESRKMPAVTRFIEYAVAIIRNGETL